jgi:small-conductance mechanosensitive channel
VVTGPSVSSGGYTLAVALTTGHPLAVAQTGGLSGSQVSEASPVTLQTVLNALAVLVLAYVVARAASALLNGLADRLTTQRFRVTLLIPVVKVGVYGGAAWLVFRGVFDLTSAQLVAFSGLLGAALGLGLKDLMADLFGGLVLVAERPYRIGDKIAVGEHYGEVTDIGLRSTTLVTPDDTAITVPNYLFFNESIANANDGAAEMLVTIEFYLDPAADVRVARRIVREAMETSQYVYVTDDHPVTVRVTDDLHYRTVTGKAYVDDLRNEFAFETDVTDRALAAFAEHDIRSPRVTPGVPDEAVE